MPSSTFFNLPESKRARLMYAARAEFARVPFAEVSINRIVRAAAISRGSFYQYFSDKRDLLNYLLCDYREALAQRALSSLGAHGDLFQAFVDILDFVYETAFDGENGAFFRSLFSDIRINADFLDKQENDNLFGLALDDLRRLVDMEKLDLRREGDFGDMLGILLSLTGETFARVFFDPGAFLESRTRFIARLRLLKRGFLQDKDATKPIVS